MSSELYDKQLKWKNQALQKAFENKEVDLRKQDEDLTFQPQIFTNLQKKFSGTAGLLTKTAGEHHIQRQAKARKEKSIMNDNFKPGKNKMSSKGSSFQDGLLLPFEASNAGAAAFDSIEAIPYGPNCEIDVNKFVRGYDEHNYVEEDNEGLAVEVLERERREWRLERIRLMQCIHHQQIELGQRAAAAHERATEIAKEFSKAIEIYEERLVLVENNVQQEIKGIKNITDTLKSSIAAIQSGQQFKTMERTMEDILMRIDALSARIK